MILAKYIELSSLSFRDLNVLYISAILLTTKCFIYNVYKKVQVISIDDKKVQLTMLK